MDLKEIDVNTRNWVDSAEDSDYWRALVNAALNLQVQNPMELISSNISPLPWQPQRTSLINVI